MNKPEFTNPSELFDPPGFSHVAVADGFCFVAGQLAVDREFNIIGGDSLYEQTVAALGSCLTALESVGLGWAHVVRRTIYTLRPEGYFSDILPALQEVVPGQQPPQTLIGIPALAVPGTLIEIELTAVLPPA